MLEEISSRSCMQNITATGRLHCDVFGALGPPKSNTRSVSRGMRVGSLLVSSLSDAARLDVIGTGNDDDSDAAAADDDDDFVVDPRRPFRGNQKSLSQALICEIDESLDVSRRSREL